VGINAPGFSASHAYDALGRRVSKTLNGATTVYQYDDEEIVAEIKDGAIVAQYLNGLSSDEKFVRQSSSPEYYHVDANGSTLALTGTSGIVETHYSYDPFGNTTITGASTNPFQYTSRENDGMGIYYYRARYYSPSLQRFISEDPLGILGGDLNFYAYAGNNPVNFIDPTGLERQKKQKDNIRPNDKYGDEADKIKNDPTKDTKEKVKDLDKLQKKAEKELKGKTKQLKAVKGYIKVLKALIPLLWAIISS